MYDRSRLLDLTSRTYALTIPFLPEPSRRYFSIAYLIMRTSDTFEDAETWSTDKRCAALDEFGRLICFADRPDLEAVSDFVRRLDEDRPSSHAGYQELIAEMGGLLTDLADLPQAPRNLVVHYSYEMILGMKKTLLRSVGRKHAITLLGLGELREYCYYVAGLVGEMLTEILYLDAPQMEKELPWLRAHSKYFGEALQLTNVLKDSSADAVEDRSFISSEEVRAQAFQVAKEDLRIAVRYIEKIQDCGVPPGFVGFTTFPIKLSLATLRLTLEKGPGHKLSRADVLAAEAFVKQAALTGERTIPEIVDLT